MEPRRKLTAPSADANGAELITHSLIIAGVVSQEHGADTTHMNTLILPYFRSVHSSKENYIYTAIRIYTHKLTNKQINW